MSRVPILALVQALTTQLVALAALTPQTNGLSVPFVARYAFAPEYDPATDLQTLTVTVVPKTTQSTLSSRASLDQQLEIDLGIQRQLKGEAGEVEALLGAVVELDNFIRECQLADNYGVVWIGSENTPIYSVEHLRRGVFTSVVTVTYRVVL